MSEQPLFDLFVPMDRRQALSRDDSLPIQSTGSVLLADISGFTPLTLALADDFGQQRGAELLTRHLNQLFTQLIARIHDFCGSVIGFNGDGLTCWFPDDDGYRAATVALAIQAIVGEAGKVQTPTGKTYALGIKVAVTAGVVRRFLVGDPGIRYIEAMAGLELDRVAAGEQAIQSGEVALGNEVVEALAGRAVISGMRPAATGEIFALLSDLTEPAEPNPWPEIPLLDREKSRDWILPHVHKRLLEEQSDFLTEFRQAVPLFFKFTGLDFVNDGLVGEKLDLLVRRFQTIMRKYDGILNDLTIGDKGSYIIGVFGAPQAHEDDVTHGVLAALEVMAEVANLDFIESAQIGLALGRIRAGTFGGDLQLTYGIQGTEANLAARLMAAAEPGQILTSPKVANAADGIAFEKLAAVQLKGLPEAMHPHRVVGRTQVQAVQALTPLFGRDKELELISRKLDQHGPEAQISIVVEGEAGIGKSRLLAELLEQSRQRGFLTLSSAGDSVEQTTPYFGWRPILMGILGIKANDDVSQQQDDVYTMLGDNLFLSERLSLLNDVLPLEFKPNALTDQMTGEARSNSIRDVMLGLRERWFASRSAMDAAAVLVFDDAQWIDTATWQLIGQIAGRRPGLLVVIGARPLESSAAGSLIQKELERLIQQPLASYIKLQSLSRNESTALAAKLLGVPTLPLSIEEMIHSRSQGNPFLSAEIAYALRDTAAMRITGDQAVINPDASDLQTIDLPDTLHGIILSRIDRLAPDHQLTLKVASVLGTTFLTRALSAIYPVLLQVPDLEGNLDTLASMDITPLVTLEPERSHAFRHVIMQEVIYNLMTFDQRRQLHRSAAEWYEQVYSADLNDHLSRLAHHWARAEDATKAIDYLDQAAGQALSVYSNWEALRLLNTARELSAPQKGWQDDPLEVVKRARRERRLGLAYFQLGHLPDCHRHYSESLALLGQPLPKTKSGMIYSMLRELLLQVRHRFTKPEKIIKPEVAQDPAVLELIKIEFSSVFFYSQEIDRMAWDILRRLNLAEQVGLAREEARGFSNLLLVTGFLPFKGLIQLYHRLTNQAVEAADNAAVRVYAHLRISVIMLQACEWDVGRQNNEAARRIADRIGDYRQWEENTATFATCYFLQGLYPRALELWEEQHARANRNEALQSQAWGLYGKAQNLLNLGQTEQALGLLEDSLAVPTGDLIDKILEASRAGAYALALTRIGRHADGLQAIRDQMASAPGPPPSTAQINELVALTQASIELDRAVRQGHFEPTSEQVDDLRAALEHTRVISNRLRKHTQVYFASAWVYWGCHQARMGNPRKAQKAWQQAIELGTENNQAYEVARAHYELGAYSELPMETKAVHLAKARAQFEQMQARFDLGQTERAQAGLENASMD